MLLSNPRSLSNLSEELIGWLWRESHSEPFDATRLGQEFYRRLTGQSVPEGGILPALPHPGLDQVLQRLLAPHQRDGYPGPESLRWDLEHGRWNEPDFLAASGLPRAAPAQPALVGRRSQLEQLLELPVGLTLVLGPAGMGKTRLLREAARHALRSGWKVWGAECLQRSQQSFQPFQDLAAELSRQTEFWSAVEAGLGDWLPAVLRLFPVLRGLSSVPPEDPGSRSFLAERNREASQALLRAMGPAVFVVDDLHWADPEVLECLAQSPWPVLGGSRGALSQASRVVALNPLDARQVEQLALSMCGPVECRELPTWSQGHPLLAAALLRNLCDSGVLQAAAGKGWIRSGGQPAWGALSPNLEELLRLRCLALTGSAQRVLRQAALLGRRFEERLLEEPEQGLHEGEQGGLIYRVEPGIWDFTHDLIGQELSKASSPSEKLEFHRRVAERLLQEPNPPCGPVSDHMWESNQLEACFAWTLQAARQSQADDQPEAAAHFWERAAHLRPDVFEYWYEWGCALRHLGRYRAARRPLQQALLLSHTALQRAQCCAQLGENDWRGGDLPEAAEHFSRGLAELGFRVPRGCRLWAGIVRELCPYPGGPSELDEGQRLAARMLDQLGYTMAYSGGISMAWANLRGLRLTANFTGLERGTLLASHAVLLVHVPALIPRSLRSIDRALQLVAHDAHHLASTEARHGSILLFTGKLVQGEATSRRALNALTRCGDRYDVRIVRYNLAYQLYWLGRLEECGEFAQEGWEESRRASDWMPAAYYARMLAVLGRVPEDFHRHFSEEQDQPFVEALRREVLGLLQLTRGRPEAAAEHLLAATTRSRRLGFSLDATWQSGWLATAYRAQAELAPLAARTELYRKGLAAARAAAKHGHSGYPVYLPQALREAALCSLGLGGKADDFAESLLWARRLKMAHEERVTLAEMTRAGLPEGVPCADSFWQFQSPIDSAHRLASRFDEAIEQVRQILRLRTTSEIIVQAEEAAEALMGATSCRVIPGGAPLERAVVEPASTRSEVYSSLMIPLGVHWGQSLKLACYHHHQADRFGEEALQMGNFLGAVVGAALENAAMLEERVGLFEAVPVGVASLDRQGLVVQANSALKEMLGDHLEGRSLEDFQYRGPGDADGSIYVGQGGRLVWADKREASLGSERSVISLSDVSWRRLHQVAAFQEQERRLLGIEMHDVSQPLIGLCYELTALGQRDCAETARKLLTELRSLMFDLRTPALDDFDLAQALSDVVLEVCGAVGIQGTLEIGREVAEVEGLVALFAYRIVVEGMSNVRRHSGGRRVLLRVRRVQSQLLGSLCDDGPGQPGSSSRRSFGLQGIAERAQLLGGWARFRRFREHGILHFRLPLS